MQEEIYNNILIMLIGEGIDITANIKEKLWIILSKYDYGKKITDLVLTDEDQNNEYIKKFLIAKTVKGCTKRTIEFYGITLRKAIPRINKNVVDITTEDIRFYLATRQINDKVTKVTANNERRALSSFFTYLHTEEYIRKNPMLKIEKIKEDKKRREALTEYEIEKMRAYLKNDSRKKAMFEVLLSTGCRVKEFSEIKISDIDNNKIRVIGKGNKERYVYLNMRAQVAIEEYLKERTDNNPYLFARSKNGGRGLIKTTGRPKSYKYWWKDKEQVHPDKNAESSYIEYVIRTIGRECGIEGVHPHKFRRTCATMAMRKGMPIEQVAHMLGHENISTTQIYYDLNQEELEENHKHYVNI